MQKILILDNNDSFTFNLAQLLDESHLCIYKIINTDKINPSEVKAFDKLLISPGPGLPKERPALLESIRYFVQNKSILGVCLGHQALAEVFGLKLYQLNRIIHGEASSVRHNSHPLFSDVPSPFVAGRYHSWAVADNYKNTEIEILARDDENHIMALAHQKYAAFGLQFHPESIMTPYGATILHNWLKM